MPANRLAGDFAKLNFIGFSKDGRHLAFEEYGAGDPGGWYSKTYFIETEKNSLPAAPVLFLDEEGATSQSFVRRQTKVAAAKNMRRFKIAPGNHGRLLVAHLLSDWTYSDSFVLKSRETNREKVKFNDYLNPNSPNQYEFYELTLNMTPFESESCGSAPFGAYKIELLLDHLKDNEKDMNTVVLQKDETVPAARGCPYGYRIESVYLYEGKLAVFLNVYSHGFEGPNMRYMVVTGKWRRYY